RELPLAHSHEVRAVRTCLVIPRFTCLAHAERGPDDDRRGHEGPQRVPPVRRVPPLESLAHPSSSPSARLPARAFDARFLDRSIPCPVPSLRRPGARERPGSVAACQRIRVLLEQSPDLPLHPKSRLVADAELALEGAGGELVTARAHELDRAEPQPQARARLVEDRARGGVHVMPAELARVRRPARDPVETRALLAGGARRSGRVEPFLQELQARVVGRKPPIELCRRHLEFTSRHVDTVASTCCISLRVLLDPPRPRNSLR